jgi:hypothetical protein
MKFAGENRSPRGKTCPSVTLSTTNPTWTDPGSNPGPRGQITIFSPTKCTLSFPDILYYNILLITATCFDPLSDHHQGITLK